MAVYIFDPNPHNITLTCPWCGTEFKPKAKNAKYCCVRRFKVCSRSSA